MADVMLVDDDGELLVSLARVLSPLLVPHTLCAAGSVQKALQVAARDKPSVAVIDLCIEERVGVESGFRLLQLLHQEDPTMRVLVLTGHGSSDHGIRALQCGASSFLEKPVIPEHVAALIRDAVVQCELRRAHRDRTSRTGSSEMVELVGTSSAVCKLRDEIAFAAATSLPVLLLGETGTGKSLCARLIHQRGARAEEKFVSYTPNFGGGDIVQSELFGHIKGAFTGALDSRRGLVLEAHRGTMFIDELDEVPPETQVRLLDLLQERRIRPIGSDSHHSIDCRFIAATNACLTEALCSGKIRRDLHHRISHCTISLPPLRERREDIRPLVTACIRRLSEREGISVYDMSAAAFALCEDSEWAGNIRELHGTVERGVYYAHHRGRSVVLPEDLRIQNTVRTEESHTMQPQLFHDQVEMFKRRLVREALVACAGNHVHAARSLGVDRGTIRRLAQEPL